MTADDLAFGYQLVTTPGVPSTAGSFVRGISAVTVVDPLTVSISWSQLFVDADKPSDNLPVLPRRLLEQHLANPEGLLNVPYWTTDYVGTGPFKLDRWDRGVGLEFSAFDDYFQGRPKLDRIVVRIIADANTQVANILAGEIDLTLPTGIDVEAALGVKERWEGTPNQVLLASSGQLRHAAYQAREDVARPRALLDPRIRQAIFRALDREAISEAVSRSTAPPADSIVAPFYDIRRDLEPAIPAYPFDVAAAQRAFQELGWTKGNDGVLRNAQGEEFRLEIAGGQSGRIEREMQAIALGWRQVGMQVDFSVFPQSAAGDNEARSFYPGVEIGGATLELFLSTRKSCRTIPAPANGWRGNNRSGYCNQEFESLLDRLQVTIPPEPRLALMRDAVRLAMTDMAVFPFYWDVDPILVAAGVSGVPLPTQPLQIHTWNSHTWDLDPVRH
jgi:peptide/nickel transport system substrate-binding protein